MRLVGHIVRVDDFDYRLEWINPRYWKERFACDAAEGVDSCRRRAEYWLILVDAEATFTACRDHARSMVTSQSVAA